METYAPTLPVRTSPAIESVEPNIEATIEDLPVHSHRGSVCGAFAGGKRSKYVVSPSTLRKCSIAADGEDVCRLVVDGMLGTSVELWLTGVDASQAATVEAFVISELRRLEAVFSVFDERSELCRWRRGEVATPGRELSEVMRGALSWVRDSGGAFNPFVGELVELWRRGEERGRVPDAAEVSAAAESIAVSRFEMVDGKPVAVGDCSGLNLNAIAKGAIVDQIGESCFDAFEASTVGVNIGGDIRHWGDGTWSVGIENPLRPFDNEPPIAVVDLHDAALATSGAARRGFRFGGQWYSHVLDPRMGWPASGAASVTVVAADVETADVVATVGAVLDLAEAVEWISAQSGVDCLVVARDGTIATTPGWTDRFGPLRST